MTKNIFWKITLIISLFQFISLTNISAQQTFNLDLDSLIIGNVYNYNYIVTKFGVPTSYKSNISENGLNERYYYNSNMLKFYNNGVFMDFVLNDTRFAIFKFKIAGGIRVGDPVSKFGQLKFGSLELISSPTGKYVYKFYDEIIEIETNSGIITRIIYSMSV